MDKSAGGRKCSPSCHKDEDQKVDSLKEPTCLPSKAWPGFIPAAAVLALCCHSSEMSQVFTLAQLNGLFKLP